MASPKNRTSGEILAAINRAGIIPIFNHPNLEVMKGVIKAMWSAYRRVDLDHMVVEIPHRPLESDPDLFQHYRQLVEWAASEESGITLLPATVLGPKMATHYLQQGNAQGIISQGTMPEVGDVCKSNGKIWIPGFLDPTTLMTAFRHAATIGKFFPAEKQSDGYDGFGILKSMLPTTRCFEEEFGNPCKIVVMGGLEAVTRSLKRWFDLGPEIIGAGMSSLVDKELANSGEYGRIADDVQAALELVQEIRN